MQKAIGYVRVSTKGQAEEGISLSAQRAKIQQWAVLNEFHLVAIHEDAGLSGGSMGKRVGLANALKAATKGVALVSYSMSRLSRSLPDMIALSARLKRQGADLVSISEKIDTTSASGKMFFNILAVLNQFKLDEIGEQTRMALAHKKAKGEVYGPVPFGYRSQRGRLIEVRGEARIIATMERMRKRGLALRDIAAKLNAEGIEGKRGGQWHASTVRYLLNRVAA